MNIFLQMHILNNLVAFRAEPVFVELEKKKQKPRMFTEMLRARTSVIFLQDWIYLPDALRRILAFENT